MHSKALQSKQRRPIKNGRDIEAQRAEVTSKLMAELGRDSPGHLSSHAVLYLLARVLSLIFRHFVLHCYVLQNRMLSLFLIELYKFKCSCSRV